jgi:lipoate-protein ligase B
MAERCVVHQLGMVAYEQAWQLQDRLAAEIAAGERPPTLLLLQHPHTYTFGRSGHAENLLWEAAELERRGVQVHWVDRGGDVTYHGPGQLVGYPLLPLAPGGLKVDPASGSGRLPKADYVGYVRRLEAVLIAALSHLGIAAGQVDGLTGVWVQPDVFSRCLRCLPEERMRPAKIAAIGVKVDARGISRHGFALNIDPQMEYWEGIVGCGLAGYPVASLADLLDPVPSIERVSEALITSFGEEFGYQTREEELSFVDMHPK